VKCDNEAYRRSLLSSSPAIFKRCSVISHRSI
jgi:hypothetical protein